MSFVDEHHHFVTFVEVLFHFRLKHLTLCSLIIFILLQTMANMLDVKYPLSINL